MSNLIKREINLQFSESLIERKYNQMIQKGFKASFPLTKEVSPEYLFTKIIKEGSVDQHIIVAKSFELKDLSRLPKKKYNAEQLQKLAFAALEFIEGVNGAEIVLKQSLSMEIALDHPYFQPLDFVLFVEAVRTGKYKNEFHHTHKSITPEHLKGWLSAYVTDRSEMFAQEQLNKHKRAKEAKIQANKEFIEKMKILNEKNREMDDWVKKEISNKKKSVDTYFNYLVETRIIRNSGLPDYNNEYFKGLEIEEGVKKEVIYAFRIIEDNIMDFGLPGYFKVEDKVYTFWEEQYDRNDWRKLIDKCRERKVNPISFQTWKIIHTAKFLEKHHGHPNAYNAIIDIIEKGSSSNIFYVTGMKLESEKREKRRKDRERRMGWIK